MFSAECGLLFWGLGVDEVGGEVGLVLRGVSGGGDGGWVGGGRVNEWWELTGSMMVDIVSGSGGGGGKRVCRDITRLVL